MYENRRRSDQEVQVVVPFYISHGSTLRTCQIHTIKTLQGHWVLNRLVRAANNHSLHGRWTRIRRTLGARYALSLSYACMYLALILRCSSVTYVFLVVFRRVHLYVYSRVQ